MEKKQVIVALGLLIDKKGRFLVTLRNEPELATAHLKWQIPGGAVEFGEKPLEALRREIKEEVGVEVRLLKQEPIVNSYIWQDEERKTQVVLLCYLCRIKKGEIKVDGGETINYRWIEPKEIKKLAHLPLTDDFILGAAEILDKKK